MNISLHHLVAFAGIKVSKARQYFFFTTSLALLAATIDAQHAPLPSFEIFRGTYLESFNIGNFYVRGNDMFYKSMDGFSNKKMTFAAVGAILNPKTCWLQGYDLAKGTTTDLWCNTTRSYTHPVNEAHYLYSSLVRYGNYLEDCTGLLQTRENNRTYLYASCQEVSIGYTPSITYFRYWPGKLDITHCSGNIINNRGRLECSDAPVEQKHILSGSYLKNCSLFHSAYRPKDHKLFAYCQDRFFTLDHAAGCIGEGRDIVFNGYGLTCISTPSKEVYQHKASLYLPPGNYLITCQDILFFPCMGPNHKGVLAARCADEFSGAFIEATLVDADEKCQMMNLGYVSNINGTLKCDPEIAFDDEDPSQGSQLLRHYQCFNVINSSYD